MTDKTLLIVVPDDHYHKKNNPTFLVYDQVGALIHESPYRAELNCEELKGQGRPTFRPFGIASDDTYLYVASHNKLGQYNKLTFEFCGLVDVPMYINTHQILKSDEDFYVAHTAVNTIGIHGKTHRYFDVSKLQCVEKPIPPDNAESHDVIHVNAITEHDGKIYFCLHNRGLYPSQFGYFDQRTYESKIIAAAGYCCHDVKILNNTLYALSSETGEIIAIDLPTEQTVTYKVSNPGKTFLRGMDILDNKIIFCGSNRYSDNTMYMNNCFTASFDTITKIANRRFVIHQADIVAGIKVLDTN
jgi:hypothetical protein